MTKIKRIWTILVMAIVSFAMFAFAGCNKGGGNTDGGDVFDDTTGYVFVIEDQDGNPLSGYKVQLCYDGGCYAHSAASNAQGKLQAKLGNPATAGAYEIHLVKGNNLGTLISFTSAEASQNNGKYYTTLQYCTITLVVTL